MPQILPTHTPELFRQAVCAAAERLKRGEVVGIPTETVYGLAANGLDPEAVRRIYDIKGRPAHNPIILHAASAEGVMACVSNWPSSAQRLSSAFWPGPLTIVLPRSPGVPDVVTAGGPTVGVRWPSHPFVQALILACGFPLAAPSANLANQISPTTAAHVASGLGKRIPLVVDGGACQVGIESTVVDCTVDPPVILRPGMIHEPSLRAVLQGNQAGEARQGATPTHRHPAGGTHLRSPGQLARHYAPKARVQLLDWTLDSQLDEAAALLGIPHERVQVLTRSRIPANFPPAQVSVFPDDPEAFARALYAQLHECDERGIQLILVEPPPRTAEWSGIWDRLKRASTPESCG